MTVSSKVLTFLVANLNVLHNYFDGSNKSIFSVSSEIFRYFKIVLSILT